MKTIKLIQGISILLLLFYCKDVKAQLLTYFENKTPCDVVIHIEDYAPPTVPGTPCTVCYSNYITLNANSGQVPYTLCSSYDICISVYSVDGVLINWYNHANWGFGCHGLIQSMVGQAGTSGNCTWSANFTSNGWEIQ
jgi:hypothetical protein